MLPQMTIFLKALSQYTSNRSMIVIPSFLQFSSSLYMYKEAVHLKTDLLLCSLPYFNVWHTRIISHKIISVLDRTCRASFFRVKSLS